MFKKMLLRKIAVLISTVLLTGLLTSCDKEIVNHSTYIPNNSSAVISVNTEQIFNDEIFNLITNTDLLEGMKKGPLSGLITDPADAGLVRFARYYFFAAGENIIESRLGVILPLTNDAKLFNYIETNYKVTITENSVYKVAEISNNHVIVWDEKTAIYVYGQLGGDLVESAISYFSQDQKNSLEQNEQNFSIALKDQSHIVAWFKNDVFLNNVEKGLAATFRSQFSLLKTLKINQDQLKDGKSIFSLNFDDGKITIDSKQYKNQQQLAKYKEIEKPNGITPLINIAGSEAPIVALSVSLKQEGLLEVMETYNLDVAFAKVLTSLNVPFQVKLDFITRFFEGDMVLFVNKFEEIKKNKMVQKLSIEGEQEQVVEEVIVKVPQVTAGITLKNEQQFRGFLKMAAGRLAQVDGVYNFNNQLYFTVKNGVLYFANTPNGVAVIKNITGKLTPLLSEMFTQNRLSMHLDLKKGFDFISQAVPLGSEACKIVSDKLNDINILQKGIDKQDVVIGKAVINFTAKEYSLISSIKLARDFFKSLEPMITNSINEY